MQHLCCRALGYLLLLGLKSKGQQWVSAMLRAGRPRAPHKDWVEDAYYPEDNDGISLSSLGRADEHQYFFRAMCGLHLLFYTMKWASSREQNMQCRICANASPEDAWSHAHTWMAQWLSRAYAGMRVIVECVPLRSPPGTRVYEQWHARGRMSHIEYDAVRDNASHVKVDFWLRECDLYIMFDGAQHVDSNMHNTLLGEQQMVDWQFAAEVLQAGKRMLRIHYQDFKPNRIPAYNSPAIQAAVADAVRHSRMQPDGSWVMFSASYNTPMVHASDADRILKALGLRRQAVVDSPCKPLD